jgi:hypothetical protein
MLISYWVLGTAFYLIQWWIPVVVNAMLGGESFGCRTSKLTEYPASHYDRSIKCNVSIAKDVRLSHCNLPG